MKPRSEKRETMSKSLKHTALHDLHDKLGAKMVEFAGWHMPIQYTAIVEEHMAVRNACGIFDVSHMGTVEVKGKDAQSFLQRMVTRNVEKIADGKAFYTVFCNEMGGVIDDLVIYKIDSQDFFVIVNAANREKDFYWMKMKGTDFDVHLKQLPTAILSVQGPKAKDILESGIFPARVSRMKRYAFEETRFSDHAAYVSRSGYTGSDGFEIFIHDHNAPDLFSALLSAGKTHDIKPCGLGARDTLRLEAGLLLYGTDMNEETTPLEAGLEWVVDLTKDDFIGKKALVTQKEAGIQKKLVCLEMKEQGVPRHEYAVYKNGGQIGKVTSGTFLPLLKKSIALAYVPASEGNAGNVLHIEIHGKQREAVVAGKIFYKAE